MSAQTLEDLSNNNGAAAAASIADPNVHGVYAKATESITFKDPLYPIFREAAHAHGKPFGAYCFLHPTVDGAAQARYLLAFAKPLPGDLEPVIDSETLAGKSTATAARTTYAALVELRDHGFDPIGYGSQSFWAQLVQAEPRLKQFRYWEADYASVLRRVPGLRTVLWQFTDRMTVAKGRFRVDGDRLVARSVAALRIPKGKTISHPAAPTRPEKRPGKKRPAAQGEPKDEKPFTRPAAKRTRPKP